jgi:hypothetical protein
MKQFINATNSTGQEIMVDPNDVRMNPAGTNMCVACYAEKALDRGDRRPQYINFHHLKFDPRDKKEMEKIFQQKAAEIAAAKKNEKTSIRRAKKEAVRKIA